MCIRDSLKDGGEIYFKTDDDDLFRDSLEYFPASGYDIEWMTFDLHENEDVYKRQPATWARTT